MNTQAPVSGWPSVIGSSSGITAGSGWNPNPEKDPTLSLACQSEHSAKNRGLILVVEDNKADVLLIREAIQTAKVNVDIDVVDDGEKALRYLERVDIGDLPCPSLVIIDINLPKKHGGEVLEEMRKKGRCASTPVVVVTSSDSIGDRRAMASLGISEYFRKPSDYDEFMSLGEIVKRLLGRPGPVE